MLLEFLNIDKLELHAGMSLVQLMSLKWGSPLESLGSLALMEVALFYEDTYCCYPANLSRLPCSTAAVCLLFYSL